MPKIVIVEDDSAIAETLVDHLQSLDYQTQHFNNGLAAKDYLLHSNYDVVLLDIMLPDYNGLDLCRDLRQHRPHTPIILLTSLDSEEDRIAGLEMGADDYVTKPFSMKECQARISALLRRCELNQHSYVSDTEEASIGFEELSVNKNNRQVLLDENTIELTAREFDLLLYFIQHQGKVFSRSDLLDAVWGYSHEGYEYTINTHINRLRRKLKRPSHKPDFIQTVWAVGYKFIDKEPV